MRSALWAEAVKLRRSPVGLIATGAIVVGVVGICAGMVLGIDGGNATVVAKLGPYAERSWRGLAGMGMQITGAGAFFGFGIVLAWMFAREFAEGTITGLFGLPLRHASIAAAKLGVYLAWAGLVSVALTTCLLLARFHRAAGRTLHRCPQMRCRRVETGSSESKGDCSA